MKIELEEKNREFHQSKSNCNYIWRYVQIWKDIDRQNGY